VITITKIIGESFNLETGEEHSSAIEISNGISSRLISVSPASIPAIVELFVQAQDTHQVVARGNVTQGDLVAGAVADAILGMEDEDEMDDSPFATDNADWPEEEGLPEESLSAYEDEDTGVGSI